MATPLEVRMKQKAVMMSPKLKELTTPRNSVSLAKETTYYLAG